MDRIRIGNIREIHAAATEFLKKTTGYQKFAFSGEMGAGKTTFIKAVCLELGALDIPSSPSFAIVYEYRTKNKFKLFHFDFYRVKNIEEVFDIGFEEYFYSNDYCFIEWPEKIASILPDDVLPVQVNVISETEREIIF